MSQTLETKNFVYRVAYWIGQGAVFVAFALVIGAPIELVIWYFRRPQKEHSDG